MAPPLFTADGMAVGFDAHWVRMWDSAYTRVFLYGIPDWRPAEFVDAVTDDFGNLVKVQS